MGQVLAEFGCDRVLKGKTCGTAMAFSDQKVARTFCSEPRNMEVHKLSSQERFDSESPPPMHRKEQGVLGPQIKEPFQA